MVQDPSIKPPNDDHNKREEIHSTETVSHLSAIIENVCVEYNSNIQCFRSPEDNDVALEESKNWYATDVGEFIVPWYTNVVRFVMLPTFVMVIYYVYWRIKNFESSSDSIWYNVFAWIFMICECFSFVFTLYQWVWMWNLKFRKKITLADLNLKDEDLPTIDIMIPCFSEPPELVHMTLVSCYHIDYPGEKISIYVCDDGNSVHMKEMVHEAAYKYDGDMVTHYVARRKVPGVPHHAKAGNLNNCILNEPSVGDLIIVFDCDMIPEPCFARAVVPFFYKLEQTDSDIESAEVRAVLDGKVGMLQTPQAFYNLDHNDLLGQSYSYFYEIIISGWDGSGATPCCGTGVTFNREALESIGGFSYGSITEDVKTSMNLAAAGFECKYSLQYLTRGVSPKELNAYMSQRLRWAVGAIQIFRNQNPLFVKGLKWKVRWLYFFSTIGVIFIIPLFFLLIIMYGAIFLGYPIHLGSSSAENYIIMASVVMLLLLSIQYLIAWRLTFSNFMRILQESFTLFFLYMRAMLIAFCGFGMGFECTKKDISFTFRENFRHALPHIVVYVVTAVALAKVICEMLDSEGIIKIFWTSQYETSMLPVPIFWTIFLWIMISSPPRVILYWYLKSRKHIKPEFRSLNQNIPVFQELPSTPLNIFPPLTPEIWQKEMVSITCRTDEEELHFDSSESCTSNRQLLSSS